VTKKIVLINSDAEYTSFERNKGAEAVMISTVELLRHSIPEAQFVTTMQCSQSLSQRLNCEVIKNRISSTTVYSLFASLKSNIDVLRCMVWKALRKYLRIDLKALVNNKKLREYSSADVIIHLGMDLYSDDFGPLTIIEHSKDILLGVMLGKPVVMWAESIGPFRHKFTRWLAKSTLNRVCIITVREELSKRNLQDIRVNKPLIYVTLDPAFLLEPAPEERVQSILHSEGICTNAGPLIGMTLTYPVDSSQKLSRFAFMKLLYRTLQYALPGRLFLSAVSIGKRLGLYSSVGAPKEFRYTKLMAQIIVHLVENLNATIMLVPHQEGAGPLVSERAIHENVRAQVEYKDKVKLVSGDYPAPEVKGIIGKCHLFIGSKMHSNIAALSQCIPTVGLAYSYKFRGIMEMLGQQNYVCSNITFEEVISKVIDAWNKRVEIRTELESRLKDVRALSTLNARLVKEFVDSR